VPDFQVFNDAAQVFRPPRSGFDAALRQENGKLFRTEAARDVFLANDGLQQFPNLPQDGILGIRPDSMACGLDAVDLEHDETERPPVAVGAPQLELERFFHEPAVEKAGERIADRLAAQGFVQLEVGEGHGDVLGHGDGEALFGFGDGGASG
jgi:hypothetical protein